MAAGADEALALELHKQLNAVPLRARRGRGQELTHQLSLDRLKADKGSKPRSKRTNSSSQEHPTKKPRTSDEHGHTSSRRRAVKRDPDDSNPSQEHDGSEHEEPKDRHAKHSDSGDSGLALDLLDDGKQQHKKAAALMANPPDPLQLLHDCRPIQAAAIVASYTVQQQGSGRKPRQPPSDHVKVFYSGTRFALSLPRSVVKTRQQLAKALNDAFVGEILSVGQGEGLTVVFADSKAHLTELGPTKLSGSSRTQAARWRLLAKTAVRIYVA